MRSIKLILALALTTLSACKYDAPVTPPAPPTTSAAAHIVIATDADRTPMLSKGESRIAVASVFDSSGQQVGNAPIAWTSSIPGVATVSSNGVNANIVAVGDGQTDITATSGNLQTSIKITVHRAVASVSVVSDIPVVGPGNTVQLHATARDLLGNPLPAITDFTFTTPQPAKVVVSPTGLVTALIASTSVTVAATVVDEHGFATTGFTNIAVLAPNTFDFASLMSGSDVQPATVNTSGIGLSYFRLNDARINYLITWTELTTPATRIQIRGPATFVQNADILVDLPVTTNVTQPWGILNNFLTAADIQSQNGRPAISLDSLATLMRRNQVYVNVVTSKNPNGELRGQIEGPFR